MPETIPQTWANHIIARMLNSNQILSHCTIHNVIQAGKGVRNGVCLASRCCMLRWGSALRCVWVSSARARARVCEQTPVRTQPVWTYWTHLLAVKNVPGLQHPADVMATCGEAAGAVLTLLRARARVWVCVCVSVCEWVSCLIFCCSLYQWLSRTIRGEQCSRSSSSISGGREAGRMLRLCCRLGWSEPELRCSDSLHRETRAHTLTHTHTHTHTHT